MNDDKKWHSGPPPSLGWWPASWMKSADTIRWWDGKTWSVGASEWEGVEEAVRCAKQKMPENYNDLIEWQHRPASWPARSKT